MPGPSNSPRNIDSMRYRRYCAFWASCLAATLAGCAAHAPRQGPPLDFEEMRFRSNLRALTADDLEGRRPGTPGEAEDRRLPHRAVSQVRPEARQRRQLCPTGAFGRDPRGRGSDALRRRGAGRLAAVASRYGHGSLDAARRPDGGASRKATSCSSATASWRREYHWDDYAGVDVRGKTVLVLLGDPGYGSKRSRGFQGH